MSSSAPISSLYIASRLIGNIGASSDYGSMVASEDVDEDVVREDGEMSGNMENERECAIVDEEIVEETREC